MHIRPKTKEEQDKMRASGRILDAVHRAVARRVTPGVSLIALDAFIKSEIEARGGTPSFLGYMGYPASSCLSVNDEVVHGIPSHYELKNGDTLGIDIGVCFEGYHTDAAVTYAVGTVTPEARKLLGVTQCALKAALEAAVAGNYVEDISIAVEAYVRDAGTYGIIRDLAGHGVGQKLQEPPEIVNYAEPNKTPLINGMTLAIEPMLSLGDWRVTLDNDNWTVRTKDNSLAAQYETTIIIRDNDPEILVAYPLVHDI